MSLTIKLRPGAQHAVRLLGVGLGNLTNYHAELELDPPGTIYLVALKQAAPPVGLGLRAMEWSEVRSFWPFRESHQFSTCIATEVTPTRPIRHVLRAPAQANPASLRVRPDSVEIKADAECGGIRVSVGGLDSGQYEGLLDIEGQSVAFHLAQRPIAISLFAAILLGALASMAVRGGARYLRTRAENEENIASQERQRRPRAIAWDRVRTENALRRARGSNRGLMMNGVPAALAELPKEDKERDTKIDFVMKALRDLPLPTSVRAELNAELAHFLRLSSDADEQVLTEGLNGLADEGAQGYEERFRIWLNTRRNEVDEARDQIDKWLAGIALDDSLKELVRGAAGMLDTLLSDFEDLFNEPGSDRKRLSREHIAVIERIGPTLRKLREFCGPDIATNTPGLRRILLCQLEDGAADVAQLVVLPDGCRLSATPARITAQSTVTFELLAIPASLLPSIKFVWSVASGAADGNTPVEVFGGPRLSWVFPHQDSWFARWRKRGTRVEVLVTPAVPGGRLELGGSKPWPERFYFPDAEAVFGIHKDGSLARDFRLSAWIAEQGALVLGTLVAGAVAMLYWMDRPFGSLGDYASLLVAGIGVDASTSSAVVKGLLETFSKKVEQKNQ